MKAHTQSKKKPSKVLMSDDRPIIDMKDILEQRQHDGNAKISNNCSHYE